MVFKDCGTQSAPSPPDLKFRDRVPQCLGRSREEPALAPVDGSQGRRGWLQGHLPRPSSFLIPQRDSGGRIGSIE